jgi:hypothetical protein
MQAIRGDGIECLDAKQAPAPFTAAWSRRDRAGYRWAVGIALACLPSAAWALVTGELADRVADVLAFIVIIFVPIAGIYVFWKVHVLPEQIAEKRHHPQKDAIRTLCLLSLVFGGMLWPIAWLWAYTKPTLHKLAYGTDKYEEPEPAAAEHGPVTAPTRLEDHLAALRHEVEQLPEEGAPEEDVAALRRDIARLEKKLAPSSRRETH